MFFFLKSNTKPRHKYLIIEMLNKRILTIKIYYIGYFFFNVRYGRKFRINVCHINIINHHYCYFGTYPSM